MLQLAEKHITKTLANCKPSEFLKQTNKIRKAVAKWLELTDVMNIRKRKIEGLDENAEPEAQKKAIAEQMKRNLNDILDEVLDKHPDETLELLALMCFVEPKDIDKYPTIEYLNAITSLIGDEAVLSFFTSLARLGNIGIFR